MTSDDYHELFRDLAFVSGMYWTGHAADVVLSDLYRRGVISGEDYNAALARIEAEEIARGISIMGAPRFCRAMRARTVTARMQ